jgi:hypothetical protein
MRLSLKMSKVGDDGFEVSLTFEAFPAALSALCAVADGFLNRPRHAAAVAPPKMQPAYRNGTHAVFVCGCGESVSALQFHAMGPRCNK